MLFHITIDDIPLVVISIMGLIVFLFYFIRFIFNIAISIKYYPVSEDLINFVKNSKGTLIIPNINEYKKDDIKITYEDYYYYEDFKISLFIEKNNKWINVFRDNGANFNKQWFHDDIVIKEYIIKSINKFLSDHKSLLEKIRCSNDEDREKIIIREWIEENKEQVK